MTDPISEHARLTRRIRAAFITAFDEYDVSPGACTDLYMIPVDYVYDIADRVLDELETDEKADEADEGVEHP